MRIQKLLFSFFLILSATFTDVASIVNAKSIDAEINGFWFTLEQSGDKREAWLIPNHNKNESNGNPYSGDVVIPEKVSYKENEYIVTGIGSHAFAEECLTSIALPNTLLDIDSYAFYDCHGLTSITIPASVKDIEAEAFNKCWDLKNIEVNPDNKYYSSENGVLYNKDKTKLRIFPRGRTGHFSIPEKVTSIGFRAFETSLIYSVYMPNSVTTMSFGAFSDCPNMEYVRLSESLTAIPGDCFHGCLKLKALKIPEGVTNIQDCGIGACMDLEVLDLPSTLKSIDVSNEGFFYSENLTSLICRAITPPIVKIGRDTWERQYYDDAITLYVPSQSIEEYKNQADENLWDRWEPRWVYLFKNYLPLEDAPDVVYFPEELLEGDNNQGGDNEEGNIVNGIKDNEGFIHKVYDITGKLILVLPNIDEIHRLQPGLYIINGKKYLIR